MAYSCLEVANELLRLAQKDSTPLTQMQLQKLVYFAHGYHLADTGEKLVEDPVEAWGYGTVFPKLRDATKKYGRDAISRLIRWGDENFFSTPGVQAIAEFSPQEKRAIRNVWKAYGEFPAFKLSALTHDPGGPWAEVYVEGQNRVIPTQKIRKYFRDLRAQNVRRLTA